MCDLQNSENLKRLVHVYRGNSALSTCFVCQIFCFDKCKRTCLNTVTFLVDINSTPDPYLKIEKLNVGTAKIPLVDGLNYLNWCTRTSECLRIVSDPEDRFLLLNRGWTVLYYEASLCQGWPCNLSLFRSKLESGNWSYPNLDQQYFMIRSQKAGKITKIEILRKPKCPPSLASLARLAVLIRYTRGKLHQRYLPCVFKVNPLKIPKCLSLNQISMMRLIRHINDPSFENPNF